MNIKKACYRINTLPIDEIALQLGLNPDKQYRGDCPIGHESKSGRCFSLNLDDNYAHCFSCNRTWSVIDLYMNIKKVNLIQAVNELGQSIGIHVSDKSNNVYHREPKSDPIVRDLINLKKTADSAEELYHNLCDQLIERSRLIEQLNEMSKIEITEFYHIRNDIDLEFEELDKQHLKEMNLLKCKQKKIRNKINESFANSI